MNTDTTAERVAELERGLASARSRADNAEAAMWRVRQACTEESYNDAAGDLVIRAADVLRVLDGET